MDFSPPRPDMSLVRGQQAGQPCSNPASPWLDPERSSAPSHCNNGAAHKRQWTLEPLPHLLFQPGSPVASDRLFPLLAADVEPSWECVFPCCCACLKKAVPGSDMIQGPPQAPIWGHQLSPSQEATQPPVSCQQLESSRPSSECDISAWGPAPQIAVPQRRRSQARLTVQRDVALETSVGSPCPISQGKTDRRPGRR